ncbi:MAG: hypothetical protein ACTMHL_12220 [Janibacter sp.]
MTTTVSTDAVIGFRLAAHHLTEQVDARRLADATGQCGVQDSPPGSAALALHARVDGLTPFGTLRARDRRALEEEVEQIAPLRGASSVDVVVETD